jgi:hypothetical protein
VEWLFDRMWPSHIRKVASLFAQALSRVFTFRTKIHREFIAARYAC